MVAADVRDGKENKCKRAVIILCAVDTTETEQK